MGTLPGQVKVGTVGDGFVRKYDFCGDEIWTSQFGSNEYAEARGISVGTDGVYVSGYTSGTFPGQTSSGAPYDAFVLKHDFAGNVLWVRQFGLYAGYTWSNGISVCDGDVYVVGHTDEYLWRSEDIFLRKFDTAGDEQWTRLYTGSGRDQSSGVSADPTGVYVVGTADYDALIQKHDHSGNLLWTHLMSSSYTTLGGGVTARTQDGVCDGAYFCGSTYGALPGQSSSGGMDAFVAEYNEDGDLLWTDQFGTSQSDYAYGISMSPDAIYVGGQTYGAFPGHTSAGPQSDLYLRKYDAITHSEVWTRQSGSNKADDFVGGDNLKRGQAIDSDGNIYIVGTTTGTLPGQSTSGGYDAFVRKYNHSGTEVWTRQFGSSGTDYGIGVWAGADAIYVCGFTNGTITTPDNPGYYDVFVRKYDLDGAELWTHQFGYGGWSYTYGNALFADDSGVYLVGYTTQGYDGFVRKYSHSGAEIRTIEFGSSDYIYAYGIGGDETGIYVCGYTRSATAFQYNVFVRKYDLDCNDEALWSDEFGAGVQNSCYSSPAVDPTGVYLTGWTTGSFPGYSNSGMWDVFLRKYDPDGNAAWTAQLGTPEFDQSYGIAVEPTGAYVTGYTLGTLPGQTSAGDRDAFVWKCDANGNEVWTYQFGTEGADAGVGISIGTAGTYANALFVAGYTSGTLPGQVGYGGYDAFVMNIREDPQDMLASLVEFVVSLNLHHGIENSLDAKLSAAQKALADLKEKNDIAAVNSLGAFKNEVLAQRGVHIPEDAADKLIKSAQAILDLLEHGGGGVQSVSVRSSETSRVVLQQNYPNPFRDATTIRFSLPERTHTRLTIHDVAGRTVSTLIDEELGAGTHTVNWSTDLPSGVYFARVHAETSSEMQRMVLLR